MEKERLLILSVALLSVSLTVKAQDIQPPQPYISGEYEGHEYADLGLPSGTLWAICNLGGTSSSDIGDYYAWGETETKDYYVWETYEFMEEFKSDANIGYYVTCTDIGNDICGTEYDAARKHWGGAWRMPHYSEIKELRRNTWWKLVRENGVQGYRIYGPNSNSIFMPMTGSMIDYDVVEPYFGVYWCGTESVFSNVPDDYNCNASTYDFDTGGINVTDALPKYVGHVIRPVFKRREASGINCVETSGTSLRYADGTITVNSDIDAGSLDIYGLDGSLVMSFTDIGKTLSVSGLRPGVYIARLHGLDRIIKTQKLLIK
ncbi:MAG: T9SS type A sorting domain-containing protein [Prevotellaceae bacterium]|nr:T9SS type A sorting domain-containing protein [Prevotellaceae bacterium]